MNKELDYSALIKVYKYTKLGGFYMLIPILMFMFAVGTMGFIKSGLFSFLSGMALFICVVGSIGYFAFAWFVRGKAISEFALKNHLQSLDPLVMASSVPPFFSGVGDSPRQANGYVVPFGNKTCNVFEYRYTTGSGKSQQTHYYSVVTFMNEKAFPHMFLDGKQNGNFSAYNSSQRISLEGDFDESFSLYVPEGEHVDALSIFSPDVMQTLLNAGRPFDIEINGNIVYVVAKGSLYDADRLKYALEFIENLDKEFAQRNVSWQPLAPGLVRPTLKRGLLSGVQIATAISVIVFFYLLIEISSSLIKSL